MSGNQHKSTRRDIVQALRLARHFLHDAALARQQRAPISAEGALRLARQYLARARALIDGAPASTRRRWKCGH